MKVQKKKGCRAIQSAPFSIIGHPVSLLAAVLFLLGAFPAPGAASGPEVRGLWVARDSVVNRGQAEQVVNFADSMGCNVLFVQARGRGDAFYRSDLVPGPEEYPGIPGSFDPLGAIIPLAHRRGIEVHAWLNLCLTWSSRQPPSRTDHILRAHPDWFMVSLNGLSMASCPPESVANSGVEGRYLSPGLAPVREYLTGVVREVAERYAIDGVHLDYVRYPGFGYDFHPRVRNEFTRQYGIDPRKAVTGEGRSDPHLTGLEQWVKFRSGQMDALVREVSRAVRRVDRRLRVSAAVKSDPEDAYYLYGQDWPGWIREGTVDFVVMMNFTSQNTAFREAVRASIRKADGRKVVTGIGAWLLTPEQLTEQMTLARESGLPGYCLFSYGACSGNPVIRKYLVKSAKKRNAPLPSEFKPYLRKLK